MKVLNPNKYERTKSFTISKKGISSKKKNLPSNFFERLLILEMELEDNFSLQTLNELISLYSVSKKILFEVSYRIL